MNQEQGYPVRAILKRISELYEAGYADLQIAGQLGIANPKQVSQLRNLEVNCREIGGDAFLDEIETGWLRWSRVRKVLAAARQEDTVHSAVGDLLDEALGNRLNNRRPERGYNPKLDEKDGRRTRWKRGRGGRKNG